MEEVLSYSRPKLRDHFEAFLLGQKVGADLNKDDRSADSSDNSSELEESLPRKEVHIKTERFENDAASNPGFSVVRIKTEKLDEDHVRVKTEKADPVEAICQPTSSASPVPCRIEVKKEKEDIVSIKTEEIDGRNENEDTRQDENHANPPSGGIVKQIKTEGDNSSDEFDVKRVKMERISDAQTILQQQITGGCRSSQVREVGDSPHGQNDDGVESPSHSPITLSIKEETAEHDEMKGLYEESNVSEQPDGPQPTDLEEYTHQRSSDRKAKNIAKMMLKNLEENLNFIDGKDRKTPRSKGFISSLKLHEMNNDFVKYKSAFSLQECSVKIQRLSEEILDQYGVNLDEIRMDEKVDVQTLKKGLFSCSECSFRSHHVKELRDHQWKHRTDTAYHQCRECNYRTKWLPGIVSHVKRVHRKVKPYECPHCDYRCACSTALKQHINIHTDTKPFKCPYCNYRSVAQASLRSHVYTHTGEKPYACPHCDYRCTQYPHLKSHLYVHTKEKPYACELCEYKTTQSTHLRSHMQVMHSNVKPFKCEHCSYASKSIAGLKIHVRKHTGERPYACVLCSYKATQSTSLRVHMRGHYEKRRCKCPICGYSSHTHFSMKNHIALCHE